MVKRLRGTKDGRPMTPLEYAAYCVENCDHDGVQEEWSDPLVEAGYMTVCPAVVYYDGDPEALRKHKSLYDDGDVVNFTAKGRVFADEVNEAYHAGRIFDPH